MESAGPGRTSPHKPKVAKQDSSRFSSGPGRNRLTATGSEDDSGTASKPHPPSKRLPQQPLHIRVPQNRLDIGRSGTLPPDIPRRTRSTPSYNNATNGLTRQAHLMPSLPSKTGAEISPVQSAKLPGKRPGMQHSQSVPSTLGPSKQKLVDRAIKARLYFLRKSGPNKFLIGGDSPDSRFHVTIGPQSCSCTKSHCVHILFVMLRVFKLSQNNPILWRRQLLNYEADELIKDFQTRVSQRSSLRKANKSMLERGVSIAGDSTSLPVTDSSPNTTEEPQTPEAETPGDHNKVLSSALPVDSVKSVGGEDSDKSEGSDKSEEEVCPICLNELDEGEDLLECSGCHNQLHQHCMDIWAGEQKQKNEDVYCPVCRSPWDYTGPPPSITSPPATSFDTTTGHKLGSPSNTTLSEDKQVLHDQIKAMFGMGTAEDLFSSDWMHREAALMLLARESISYLLPSVTAKFQSRHGRRGDGRHGEECGAVQKVCMAVVVHSCNDVVLKVFLAALELLRVVLGYSLCYNAREAAKLQELLKPLLPTLLSRCGDAQKRVKECSIDTVCNLCLGQEGPLSVGSCCGHQASCGVSNVRLILSTALKQQNSSHSWNWWLGRITFIEKLLTRFSWEFLLPQCMLKPLSPSGSDSDSDDSHSGTASDVVSIDSLTSNVSPIVFEAASSSSGSAETSLKSVPDSENSDLDSLSPVVKNNLLMQCWYFAAKATQISHRKVSKIACKVIVHIAKVLRDDPSSLEVIYDVIAKCHRTAAEGLLDKVLAAREKPQEFMVPRKKDSITLSDRSKLMRPRRLHSPDQPVLPAHTGHEAHTLTDHTLSRETSAEDNFESPFSSINVEKSLNIPQIKNSSPINLSERSTSASPINANVENPLTVNEFIEEEFLNSEDSFHSATSDLDRTLLEEGLIAGDNKSSEEGSSSTSNSHDSRSGDQRQLRSDSRGGVASGGGVADVSRSYNLLSHPYYKRQSTVDSAISSELDSSLEQVTTRGIFPCKDNIEDEEAEQLAKVRSMMPEDPPHPFLSNIIPPSEEVLVYVQNTVGRESLSVDSTDGYTVKPYIEGVHWKKGKVIGTGAFCTCHLSRDLENGTMFAVKQVSYARNTKEQEEEELSRLREEIAMLGRLNHSNIVRCLGATQQDGHINIFVEWMAGGCLDAILSDFGPLKESVVCNYTKQVCLGIAYLHENHVIHRDLKGGNILLDSTGRRIRIADFGSSARLAANTTGPGEFLDMEGTVAFMAPEVVRGGTYEDSSQAIGYGRKCDVWSIGCVVIQMITAKPPWVGSYDVRNKYQLIFKIGQTTTPPPLPMFSNPALKDLTIRCLEVSPADRPSSAELLKHPLFQD